MKPHGSTNWLICRNCGRIYTHYTNDITIRNLSQDNTQKLFCSKCKNASRAGELSPIIITPTYIKSLENTHLKTIWQQMFIEVSDADVIYFIGYSMPNADFEFKYLLKKSC